MGLDLKRPRNLLRVIVGFFAFVGMLFSFNNCAPASGVKEAPADLGPLSAADSSRESGGSGSSLPSSLPPAPTPTPAPVAPPPAPVVVVPPPPVPPPPSACPAGTFPYRDDCLEPVRAPIATDPFPSTNTYYTKVAPATGGLVAASNNLVQDRAILEGAYWARQMLKMHPEYVAAFLRYKIKIAMVSRSEPIVAIPEYRGLTDVGARGGGPTTYYNACAADEANALCAPEGGGYGTWGVDRIFIHEFGHAVHFAIKNTDPALTARISAAFAKSETKTLWANTYALRNSDEYFAELTQSWFNANRPGPAGGDGLHNDLTTKADILARDPDGAALMTEVYGPNPKAYSCPP